METDTAAGTLETRCKEGLDEPPPSDPPPPPDPGPDPGAALRLIAAIPSTTGALLLERAEGPDDPTPKATEEANGSGSAEEDDARVGAAGKLLEDKTGPPRLLLLPPPPTPPPTVRLGREVGAGRGNEVSSGSKDSKEKDPGAKASAAENDLAWFIIICCCCCCEEESGGGLRGRPGPALYLCVDAREVGAWVVVGGGGACSKSVHSTEEAAETLDELLWNELCAALFGAVVWAGEEMREAMVLGMGGSAA